MRKSHLSLTKPFSLRESINFSGRNILRRHGHLCSSDDYGKEADDYGEETDDNYIEEEDDNYGEEDDYNNENVYYDDDDDGDGDNIIDDNDNYEEKIIDSSIDSDQMLNGSFAPYFENLTSAFSFCWVQKHYIQVFETNKEMKSIDKILSD
ncbi:unnamed protein product [Rhizophagus irregularis]|nr:unnamed protein product [Rhizophagus irregularis]